MQTGDLATISAPGAWLRLTAISLAAAAALATASGAAGTGTAHRALAALTLPPLVALGVAALVSHRSLRAPAAAAGALLLATAVVTVAPLHAVLAAAALAGSLVLAAVTFRGQPVPAGALRDYATLTKPRVMSLLLVTGACGYVVGARGAPDPGRLALTVLGLALACGGASALNHVLDRDIDRLMGARTERRPVAAGRLTAPRALEFGLTLSALSFTLLAVTVNLAAAALALVGNLFYVLVYTGYLKRRGPSNIVIGGIAGAVPPLVGYAAATGSLALPALWLFLIVFLWTPPHFWALALLIRDNYAAAKVPMLPVVRGERETTLRIVRYSIALVALTTLPFAFGSLGVAFLAGALVLGAVLLALAWRLRREPTRPAAAALFHYSLLYLALLFVAAALDAAL
jgi:protoheme IX farnesyltransferase